MFRKNNWGRAFAASLLSLTLLGSGCNMIFGDDSTEESTDKKDGEKKDGEKKDGDAKPIPAYAPEGDGAEAKKAGAAGIDDLAAAKTKAAEIEKALDEALAAK